MFRLDGKTALVTGASQNLGRAMALALAGAGASVVVNARQNQAGVDAVAEEIRRAGGQALPILGDVGDPAEVDRVVGAAEARFGRVDILVNNAAVRPRHAFLAMTFGEWDEVLRSNLLGPVHCARRVAPGMVRAGHGRIVNISGIDAYDPMTHRAHNVTCKAGLIGLTRALAAELGPRGVTTNSIVAGIFDTSRDAHDYPMWPLPEEVVREMVPVGRLGKGEEIGALCLFLASAESSYVNGQAIHCNGGRVMV